MSRTSLLATAGLALCAVAAASPANDEKEIHASACQPYTNSPIDPAALKVRANGITNGYSTSKYVICPVLKDREAGWVEAGAFPLNVWFRRQAGGADPKGNQCTLSFGSESYGPVKSITKNAMDAEIPNYAYAHFQEAMTNDTLFGGATLVCKLVPGNTLEYIYIDEQD